MFPVEIWEEILKHADAKDLLRLQRVSRTWYAITAKILEKSDGWFRQCINDIPEKFWLSLVEHRLNREQENTTKNPSQCWLHFYKSWKEWHRMVEKNPQIQTFEPLPQHRTRERITCVAALENIIAIGSTEGYITFYDTAKDKILYTADHAEFLENVQLFRKGNTLFACSSSIRDRVKLWTLHPKNAENCLQSPGSFITASLANCFIVNNQRLVARNLPRWDPDHDGLLIFEDMGCSTVLRVSIPGNEIVAAGSEHNELTLYTTKNKSMRVVTIKEGHRVDGPPIAEPEIQVRYYRIFKAGVAACIGVYGEVGFSINGSPWKIYNLFKKFGAPVTTVVFHVALLALGLQSGEVHLFTVNDTETLKNFDFETTESRKLMLDTEAIISLTVTEHDSTQYIVAASNRLVHLAKFK